MSNQEKIILNSRSWASLKYQLANHLLKNAFSNDKLNHKIKPYETIYHYTDINGLIAILESQSLFSTNINFLNDSKEFKHGVELIDKNIKLIKETAKNKKLLQNLKKETNTILDIDKYVICFSKNGDLLSQWRSYGNKGKGIAIGFEPHEMEGSMAEQIFGLDIIYDENIQNEIIEEYLKIIPDYFEKQKDLFDWKGYDYNSLVSNTTIEFLEDIISTFKNPSFSEEQEFRIEYKVDGTHNKPNDKKIFFRSSENLIIPYIKLTSNYKNDIVYNLDKPNDEKRLEVGNKLPLKEIIIGPSLDYKINKLGIEKLLIKTGYNNIEIKESTIPYRI